MSDPHEWSATRQVSALRSGEISSRELTDHYLTRIDRHDPRLGAFVTVAAELAADEATRADGAIARGEYAPLTGLPLAIKDLAPTAGVRTTFGSVPLQDHVPTADSGTVRALRQAGAVLVGKTSTPEFGATCYTENGVTTRPSVTPYATARYASGSSGGSAAAVAGGLVPVAHGSDGAGSVRTPAATCHLIGMKPSRGLVSAAPATSFLTTGSEGPLARTVADAALLLDVMAQRVPGDLYGWRPATSFTEAIAARPGRPLTIATWTGTGLDGVDAHPESVRAAARAAAVLRDLGHTVREIPHPAGYAEPVRHALHRWFAYSVDAAVDALVPAERRHLLQPVTRHLAATGAALSGRDVVTLQAVLARYASTVLAALDDVDVALTPTTNGPPVPIGHYTAAGPEHELDAMLEWSCHTPWANLTGQPAISVPSHTDADGLPHGVQLVGRPRGDAALLALAAQLEDAGLWDGVGPPPDPAGALPR